MNGDYVEVPSIKKALAKFNAKEDTSKCWMWTGALSSSSGYGSHRYIWLRASKTVPDRKFTLDHFLFPSACIGKLCVNPSHLRPASQRENVLRGDTLASNALAATHCPKGHEYNAANTHYRASSGKRDCKACRREYDRSRYSNPERRESMRKANNVSQRKRRALK